MSSFSLMLDGEWMDGYVENVSVRRKWTIYKHSQIFVTPTKTADKQLI